MPLPAVADFTGHAPSRALRSAHNSSSHECTQHGCLLLSVILRSGIAVVVHALLAGARQRPSAGAKGPERHDGDGVAEALRRLTLSGTRKGQTQIMRVYTLDRLYCKEGPFCACRPQILEPGAVCVAASCLTWQCCTCHCQSAEDQRCCCAKADSQQPLCHIHLVTKQSLCIRAPHMLCLFPLMNPRRAG